MKSILVIFSQGPLAGQRIIEALSATLVLATFGHSVKVCLLDDALPLLNASPGRPPAALQQADLTRTGFFKSAHAMLESFEFYDLLPVWIISNAPALASPLIATETVSLTPELLSQFDQVMYW